MDRREIKLALINSGLINQDGWISTGTESSDFNDEFEQAINNIQSLFNSERLKWNKEMKDMIGEDEGEKKELNNIDKAFGVTGFTVVNDKQMIRNQFRHQLLEQLSIKEKNEC